MQLQVRSRVGGGVCLYFGDGSLKCSFFISSSLELALKLFSDARPPGIYKADYLMELYKRFDDPYDCPPAPELPDWCCGKKPFRPVVKFAIETSFLLIKLIIKSDVNCIDFDNLINPVFKLDSFVS